MPKSRVYFFFEKNLRDKERKREKCAYLTLKIMKPFYRRGSLSNMIALISIRCHFLCWLH
jgi:hypothetical protein